MASCFCGCGRRVGFGSRGMNKNGARTLDVVARLRDERDYTLAEGPAIEGGANPGDWQEAMDRLGAFIEQGEDFVDFWRDCIHGEELPPPGEAQRIKRNWIDWYSQGKSVASNLEDSRRFAERLA